jgi:hypothetical protein
MVPWNSCLAPPPPSPSTPLSDRPTPLSRSSARLHTSPGSSPSPQRSKSTEYRTTACCTMLASANTPPAPHRPAICYFGPPLLCRETETPSGATQCDSPTAQEESKNRAQNTHTHTGKARKMPGSVGLVAGTNWALERCASVYWLGRVFFLSFQSARSQCCLVFFGILLRADRSDAANTTHLTCLLVEPQGAENLNLR